MVKKVEKLNSVYEHYGAKFDREEIEKGKISAVDFLIGKEDDLQEITANMAGFGTNQSQRVIIDYDKGYGYFIAKRIKMDYGTHRNAP